MLLALSLVILAYLSGSVSSAVLVCRLLQVDDPRTHGSNNPGATNVLRLHGKKAAALTLAGDVLKGFLPVWIAHALAAPDYVIAGAGLAAFCGHVFPVFFGFRGGKGVATLIGVLLGIYWLIGVAFCLTWLTTALLFRYSSLAGLVAAGSAPFFTALLKLSIYSTGAVSLMAMLLFWRHRSNIRNLLTGKEDKIGINR